MEVEGENNIVPDKRMHEHSKEVKSSSQTVNKSLERLPPNVAPHTASLSGPTLEGDNTMAPDYHTSDGASRNLPSMEVEGEKNIVWDERVHEHSKEAQSSLQTTSPEKLSPNAAPHTASLGGPPLKGSNEQPAITASEARHAGSAPQMPNTASTEKGAPIRYRGTKRPLAANTSASYGPNNQDLRTICPTTRKIEHSTIEAGVG
ncbi:hypothetical protein BJ741DRAFT_608864 [Chytriomyces cf. hyalinus JEL632]|nr:hypothetical protein BJ741DRAFT_608864 [Chytriomyces cf. hyalinus JEL632]